VHDAPLHGQYIKVTHTMDLGWYFGYTMLSHVAVFWGEALCSDMRYPNFGRPCWLHHHPG